MSNQDAKLLGSIIVVGIVLAVLGTVLVTAAAMSMLLG